eukprot:Gb_26355 [translate_table: standard]
MQVKNRVNAEEFITSNALEAIHASNGRWRRLRGSCRPARPSREEAEAQIGGAQAREGCRAHRGAKGGRDKFMQAAASKGKQGRPRWACVGRSGRRESRGGRTATWGEKRAGTRPWKRRDLAGSTR